MSAEEWQARVDLAACYRLMDLYGMTDLIANHISMRVPGEPDHFLINAYGLLYDEITASSLIKIDHDGNVLAKPEFGRGLDYGVNRAGFVIHSAHPHGQARRELRHPHPHLGRHGGLDHGMRAAGQHPDRRCASPRSATTTIDGVVTDTADARSRWSRTSATTTP